VLVLVLVQREREREEREREREISNGCGLEVTILSLVDERKGGKVHLYSSCTQWTLSENGQAVFLPVRA